MFGQNALCKYKENCYKMRMERLRSRLHMLHLDKDCGFPSDWRGQKVTSLMAIQVP